MAENANRATLRCDYVIVGAGPAGLQLGYFLQKANRDYLILEAGDTPGTFFRKLPRHRSLISSNKIHTGYSDPEINLRWDWNSLLNDDEESLFKNYSKSYFPAADDLVRYLIDFAKRFDLKIKYRTRVVNVKKNDGFEVFDEHGNTYCGLRLIVASGMAKPYLPPIPGIELVELYSDVSIDPKDFTNQRVLIIGKGNSGFETADNLIETAAIIHVASPNPIAMAWKTHFVGHLRAVNNNLLDTYQLKSQNAVIDASIDKIERRDGKFVVSLKYTHANGEKEDLVYDRVIACTGFRFDDSIFDESCGPVLTIDDRFPDQTSEWESINVKDLYFGGTLTQARNYKKATSGFIHGFRYNSRVLHRIFEHKYHGRQWHYLQIDPTPEALADAVIGRVNKSSALWQQFGFLCDLIVVPGDGQSARYYNEMPVAYVHDTELGGNEHYYIVTLDFGKITGDPFNIVRHPNPSLAERSTFLHPVIQRFAGNELIDEHHILEDLYGEWLKKDIHVLPLREFFNSQIAREGYSYSAPAATL